MQDIRLDFHNVQYLYTDGDNYYFMDLETFDQPAISAGVGNCPTTGVTDALGASGTLFWRNVSQATVNTTTPHIGTPGDLMSPRIDAYSANNGTTIRPTQGAHCAGSDSI